MSDWETAVYQTEEGETTWISWGPFTTGTAELYCIYGFFDTEKEAAEDFLNEVAQHPEAQYHQSQYQDALKVVQETNGGNT
jgi:hypothetical protein